MCNLQGDGDVLTIKSHPHVWRIQLRISSDALPTTRRSAACPSSYRHSDAWRPPRWRPFAADVVHPSRRTGDSSRRHADAILSSLNLLMSEHPTWDASSTLFTSLMRHSGRKWPDKRQHRKGAHCTWALVGQLTWRRFECPQILHSNTIWLRGIMGTIIDCITWMICMNRGMSMLIKRSVRRRREFLIDPRRSHRLIIRFLRMVMKIRVHSSSCSWR